MDNFCRMDSGTVARETLAGWCSWHFRMKLLAIALVGMAVISGCRKEADRIPTIPAVANQNSQANQSSPDPTIGRISTVSEPAQSASAEVLAGAEKERPNSLLPENSVEPTPEKVIAEKEIATNEAGSRTPPVPDPVVEQDLKSDESVQDSGEAGRDQDAELVEPVFPQELVSPKWKRMDPTAELWIDFENRQVVVGGRICFREGYLEMFACPAGTKEHESVVAVNSSARLVHACLLALGAEPGSTVSWDPDYKPASGPVVDIEVRWMAEGKEVVHKAQEMVLDMTTNQPMAQEWVFGGSRQFSDPVTKAEFYGGDGGEFICLSNFSTATIDIPVPSSDSVAQLMFAANTENIPNLEHRVLMYLKPRIEAKKDVEPSKTLPVGETGVDPKTDAGKSGGQN